jgi:hypothetical protein
MDRFLAETRLVDFRAAPFKALIEERNWLSLSDWDKIGSAYDFVRNEVHFGYNAADALPASKILVDGYGQCNTKGILLMALLRGLGIRCRFHGFTIDKALQRGIVPEFVYPLAPARILHSWVEIEYQGRWIELEGFILDQSLLTALQDHFPQRSSICAYGIGTNCLQMPEVEWKGDNTYIQKTGIKADYGVFDSPDDFFAVHSQLTGPRGLLYRFFVRHWMNRRVAQMRSGIIPQIPGATSNDGRTVLTGQMQETR